MRTVQTQRQHRATVARVLLSLHESGELDRPELWTFERLAQLPAWCLLDESSRTRLQAICGVVVLALEMVQWLNGAAFRAVAECVGRKVLEALLDEAHNLEGVSPIHSAEPSCEHAADLVYATGAAVLHSSLDSWMPIERLTATLAPTDERFDRSMALAILEKAEVFMVEEANN